MTHHIVNAKRLLCPLPVIRLQQAINRADIGDTIEVQCTDPGVLHDIPAWCRVHGHVCLDTQRDEFEITVLVKKV